MDCVKSDVYFVKTRDKDPESRRLGLSRLLEHAGPFRDYKKDEFIPLKLTIGDSQCVYHMSPDLVKITVSKIKETGAKPFLFDTNVIYKGERLNAIDHMTLAQGKGFGHTKVGAPFIVADGLFGQDGREYQIDSKNIKKIKIPSFIGMLDNLVCLSHATGHVLAGYAGAIKNIAMGMSCRPTKQAQHSSLKPHVIDKKCVSCGCCVKICPAGAISLQKEKALIDQSKCVGCGECICACKFDAIFINWSEDHNVFAERMADTANFILSKFKNKFFITFAFDITKECDCISTKNEKIFSKDLGILASRDPLALDKATVDLISEGALARERLHDSYRHLLEYGREQGLGSMDYNLVDI
ncbi:MAG: DUF362 domain-containing protein [Candidatus Omnitrophota bacterium]